jgi:hypothetical protein
VLLFSTRLCPFSTTLLFSWCWSTPSLFSHQGTLLAGVVSGLPAEHGHHGFLLSSLQSPHTWSWSRDRCDGAHQCLWSWSVDLYAYLCSDFGHFWFECSSLHRLHSEAGRVFIDCSRLLSDLVPVVRH